MLTSQIGKKIATFDKKNIFSKITSVNMQKRPSRIRTRDLQFSSLKLQPLGEDGIQPKRLIQSN